MKKSFLLISILSLSFSMAHADSFEISIVNSSVNYQFGCGMQPPPGQPPHECPATAAIQFQTILPKGCADLSDLQARLIQKPDSQVLHLFRQKGECVTGNTYTNPSNLSNVSFTIKGFDSNKALKIANPALVLLLPRP